MFKITYKDRTLWQEIKEDLKIIWPWAILAMVLDTIFGLTPMAFMGFCVAPALIIKMVIRYKRGDYKTKTKTKEE